MLLFSTEIVDSFESSEVYFLSRRKSAQAVTTDDDLTSSNTHSRRNAVPRKFKNIRNTARLKRRHTIGVFDGNVLTNVD